MTAGCTVATMRSQLRSTLVIIGVVAIVVGAIFSGQGMGLIPGSFMTGDSKWLVIGLIIVVVGIVLVVLGAMRPRGGRRKS